MILHVCINLFQWWHAGTGESGAGDLDEVVVRDALGLPFLPGKTLKGLFRESAQLLLYLDRLKEEELFFLFGPQLGPGENPQPNQPREGALRFSNAWLPQAFRDQVRSEACKARKAGSNRPPRRLDGLYEVIAATAIDKQGLADTSSLRRIEVTLPVPLEATVTLHGIVPSDLPLENVCNVLSDCAALIRRLGVHRHRGLGRCHVFIRHPQEKE